MKLRDPKKLVQLMEIQEISQHELALAAGWRSHTYLGRLIRGQAATGIKAVPAARIAKRLGVPIDDLFVTRLSSDTSQNAKRKSAA